MTTLPHIMGTIYKHKTLIKTYTFIILGNFILAFGIRNFHTYIHFGDTGLLGLGLFLYHEFHLNIALSVIIINLFLCILAFEHATKQNIIYSLFSGFTFSLFYLVLGFSPFLLPNIYNHPLISAVLGGLCNGLGMGICAYYGNSPFYDEGLILFIRRILYIPEKFAFVIVDLVSIILSLTYTPINLLPYSLLCIAIKSLIVSTLRH